jgi:protein TonB
MNATTIPNVSLTPVPTRGAPAKPTGIMGKGTVLLAGVAGFAFSVLLFGLLYSAIHASHFVADKAEALQTIDFVRLKRDSEVETLSRRKPPPPPAQPPPPAKMRVAAESVSQGMTAMEIPTLNLSATVGGGPMAGSIGKGGGSGMFDGDLLPLQRIPPAYPRDAARAGVTGWVTLELVVNADGSVRSAKVTDSKPRGVFEASAVQAVMRWKFKPKIENGKPVEQRGSQKIDFNLNAPKA